MEQRLVQRVEAFLRESDMPPTVFGRAAIGDPRLVSDLRAGRETGIRVTCRVEHFMNKWRADFHTGRVARYVRRRRRSTDAAQIDTAPRVSA
ncbi:hypothetical protein [Sphingopyxis solisilvae]|uniref:hypothetical protein n=1 Tax=Sphingopyxis solisilvae TaxID=1886788 RepID=UPI001892CD9B|nr:hypothetical protein [Sphingopyxis solisilvae]